MRDEEKKDPTEQPPDAAESGESEDERDLGERMGMGMALGTSFGVALALVMDNWAMVGVGIAMGAAFAAVPWGNDEGDDEKHGDDENAEGPGQ